MAYFRRRYRRRFRPRRYGKKRSVFKRYRPVRPHNAMGPLSVKQRAKLIYSETFKLDADVGVPATYVFTCNGLYDPNITGGGHQPRGFDQMMTLYDHYLVKGAKITIWPSNEDSSYSAVVACFVSDTLSPGTSINDFMERRYVKILSIGPDDHAERSLSVKVNPNKFLGGTDISERKGSSTGNPAEQCYFVIGTWSSDYSVNPGQVCINVRIEYATVFMEPKQPAQS